MTALFEIEPNLLGNHEALVAPMARVHASIAAVAAGCAEGRAWLDDEIAPTVALIEGPEGTYLLGAPRDEAGARAIADILHDWVYLHVEPHMADVILTALPNPYMVRHRRLAYRLRPDDHIMDVPDGLTLAADPDGIGYRLFNGRRSIGHCLPDLKVRTRSEIGIWVDPEYRRRGVGTLLVGATLRAAYGAGITDIGWHCHASNQGSAAIARKFAVGNPVETLAYSASLPAENVGDLEPAECRDLAAHFESGARQIGWLRFHAACGWALAGDEVAALDAVERLVAGGWHGQAEWLTGHWALRALGDHQRFRAAVETLKKQKTPPG